MYVRCDLTNDVIATFHRTFQLPEDDAAMRELLEPRDRDLARRQAGARGDLAVLERVKPLLKSARGT